MLNKIDNKQLLILSIVVSFYFAILFLNAYVLNFNNVFIGIIQELVTIPMLLALLFLFLFSIVRLYEDNFSVKKRSFWAFIMLSVVGTVMVGSFLVSG